MDNEFISNKIREARKMRNMTQGQLAKQLNKSVSNISDMERGSIRISAEILYEIARILGKPIEFFFDQETPTESPDEKNVKFIDLSLLPSDKAQELAMFIDNYIALEKSTKDSTPTSQQIGESVASYVYLKTNIKAFTNAIKRKGEELQKDLFEDEPNQVTDYEE